MAHDERDLFSCLRVDGESKHSPAGRVVPRGDDEAYRIDDYDRMPPFFVSLTSPEDHWMFLSTTGGITAGRRNADHAIFPYGTSDRIDDTATTTGGITVMLVEHEGERLRWEPFARAFDGIYRVRRSVEKNATGNIITFEERNEDLGLVFRQTWTNSPEFGIVRSCSLRGETSGKKSVKILDGIRNTLPALTTAGFQGAFSNLLDAYKRNELLPDSGVGVFGLSAVPTDTAEPSEALAATTWWQVGLKPEATLLSTEQLEEFRHTGKATGETDVKGRRGAYIVVSEATVGGGVEAEWLLCGEVDQSHADVVLLERELRAGPDEVRERVMSDVAGSTSRLKAILSRNDGVQATGDALTRLHQMSNVTYNVMRGGYFAYGYSVPIHEFTEFLKQRNKPVADEHADLLASLPADLRIDELRRRVDAANDADLSRLALEYLPITFSRRHGDPTRPWNAFSIETRDESGRERLAYQGNWRDIFQNWEALLRSAPVFVPNVISKFLNATTVDGYNPYRVTDDGIDWERPDPDSPWANIGYWGDHQIVYLLKLLEIAEDYLPGALGEFLTRRVFSFADVPYVIASFEDMLADPYNTITFDSERDRAAMERYERIGGDGKLVHRDGGGVVHATMLEKLVILALAKASNFVPGGGIWMNTQRPEWNDANNALVGKGTSVVTTAYLERYASFVLRLLERSDATEFELFDDTCLWVEGIVGALGKAGDGRTENSDRDPRGAWNPSSRLSFMRQCAESFDSFRDRVREHGLSSQTRSVAKAVVVELFETIERFAAETVKANRRDDELYHSYNTIAVERDSKRKATGIALFPLYEMLEGQVAAVSAQSVSLEQAERTLDGLRSSALYRPDQHSYMLYPNRELPGFMERNTIHAEQAQNSSVIQTLLADPDQNLVIPDVEGGVHFHPSFRNAGILRRAAERYVEAHPRSSLGREDIETLVDLYEDTFQHQYFTGRSGTFYGYEGLGSIYWHMVSKLLLATQEKALGARRAGNDALAQALRQRYFDVRRGIGFNKAPAEYGAFPIDPYSHTPYGGGAKQPGMTGQVKEEIITRFAELGLLVADGAIVFDRFLVEDDEFAATEMSLSYVDVHGANRELAVPSGSFAFTFCQTPIVVSSGAPSDRISVQYAGGRTEVVDSLACPTAVSRAVFEKSGEIERIDVSFAG